MLKKFFKIIFSILCLFIPKKVFINHVRNERFIDFILDIYGTKNRRRTLKKYVKCEGQRNNTIKETIVVCRGKGNIVDTGAISDYINCKLTAILNNIEIIFLLSPVDGKCADDLFPRIFKQPNFSNCYKKISMRDFLKSYPNVYIGNYLIINKYKNYFYRKLLTFTDEILLYIQQNNEKIGKNMVGVFLRGTDYNKLHPKNHPIQASIDEVFECIDKEFQGRDLFLVTEDKQIKESFTLKYGQLIHTSESIYFDMGDEGKWISNVKIGLADEYYARSKLYLCSLMILSLCDDVVASFAGGSVFSINMHKGPYNKLKLIKKGFY